MDDVTPAAAALLAFKAQEKFRPECVHPLIRDPVLRNMVIAWELSPVTFRPPDGAAPEGEAARWAWLWSGTSFDREALSNALRIDSMSIRRLVERAAAFRLIYPDGTTNRLAIQFVQGEISKDLGGKRRPREDDPPKPAPAPMAQAAKR